MIKNLRKKVLVLTGATLLTATSLFGDFYVMVHNKKKGPLSVTEIEQMVQDGQVNENSFVWQNGMKTWGKAGEQKELSSIFSTPPPPPPSSASANQTPPPMPSATGTDSLDDINKVSDPKTVPMPSASDSVEDWSNEVLQKFGLSSYGENNGKYILFAQQSVSLQPTDPQYGDALVNAIDKAMMKIQEQYVTELFGSIATEKIKSLYMDRSTNAKQLDLPPASNPTFWSKFWFVINKRLDVEEKKLDQELLKMGVSPEQLQKATPKIKKDLFKDKFIKNTIQKASGSISGLVPVQTTLIRDNKGRTVVGIVAIASPKTKQIAKDISLQRASLVKGKGRDIMSLLPNSSREFLSTMGIRLVYDKDGSPAIISYGIASYRPDSGDDYIDAELRSEAKNAAIANADSQIAEMVNGYMSVKNKRKNGEETRKFVEREVKFDSETVEKSIKNIIKIVNKNAKSSAKMKLQGISTVKNWRYTSKEGVKFVGVVRVWKYSTLAAVKDFKKPKSQKKAHKKYNNFHQESKVINSMDDF